MSRWFPHPWAARVSEEQVDEAEVNLTVDEALHRERVRTIDACKAIVLRKHGNDYTAVDTLAELEALKNV